MIIDGMFFVAVRTKSHQGTAVGLLVTVIKHNNFNHSLYKKAMLSRCEWGVDVIKSTEAEWHIYASVI